MKHTMTIHSLTPGANGEGQGEIDEGFDEEFCDMEDICLQKDSDVNNLTPSLVTLDELTDKELHHLLAEGAFNSNDDAISFPNPALLDDFDLGVDVLDSEQSTHSLLDCEPLKSPVFSNGPPCSPYHIATPSPVLVTASDFQTMTLNDCNALMVNSVAIGDNMSDFSGSPAPSCSRQCDDLDMLCSVCEDVGSLTDLPRPSLYSPPPCPPSPHMRTTSTTHPMSTSPSLILEATLRVELSEVHSKLSNHLPQRHSPSNDRYPPSSGGLTSLHGSGHLGSGQVNIKLENGARNSTCSRSSQTSASPCPPTPTVSVSNSTMKHTCGATLPPSSPLMTLSPHSPSCASTGTKDSKPSGSENPDQSLINMPFHQFKQILDSSEVPETDKEEAKCIRRRGKNKVAAKNCRQRKTEIIFGLQREIEQLKEAKSKMAIKSRNLQAEITMLRQRCALAGARNS